MSAPKVIWTQREWALIAEWFRDNGIDPKQRGFAVALRKAQEAVLPKDRHRCMVGLTTKVRNDVAMAISMLPPKEHKSWTPPAPPPTPKAEELSTEELLVELARRIARFLEPKPEPVTLAVDRGFHPKHDPSPQREERTAKPKVLVVGPRGTQQDRLCIMFPLLDLRFVTCEENPALVRDRGFHCREIILWTKFMNHAQQESAKTLEGTVPTWYANGLEEVEARLRSHV